NNGHVIKANEYDNTVDSRTHNRITWEKFTIEKLDYNSQGCLEHGSKIKLKTYWGTYLKAVDGDLIHTHGNDDETSTFTLRLHNGLVRN
ncbi:MAG: hypothetical protein HWE27_14555, partial [Gammaproteobacteria bacterium]|nr:hypothetical protein [Gammaproteobacteria bacterium]